MPPSTAPRPRPDHSFERLYRRHVASVYRYALAMLRNPSDAEDVTQTTFLNAYRVYQRGERPRAAHSWFIAIAHNACCQRLREVRRRAGEVSLEERSAVSLTADEEAPRVDDIQRALGNLALNQRAALVMREVQGRKYAEIGDVLGLSTSAVETLIFRARRALREQLEGSLTCAEAERAISRQLDRRLPRSEKGVLRAHLRECAECSSLARRERARRAAFRGLAAIPLPQSLASFLGGGSAAGGGITLKVAAVLAAGAAVGGTGYEAAEHAPWRAADRGSSPPASSVSRQSGDATRPESVLPRRAARSPRAWRIVATPARRPSTFRAEPTRPKAKPVAVKTAGRRALPSKARVPKAKSPRWRGNAGAQDRPAGRIRPDRAKAPGQTKAKPRARRLVPAGERNVRPPGRARKDDASPVKGPRGRDLKAGKHAASSAAEPPGRSKPKP
jgi:RNA polymerase sigma-70 factor (ECF subfamily)